MIEQKILFINIIIDNICNSSIKVANFKAYKENGFLIAKFNKNDKIFMSKNSINEICDKIIKENIADDKINDYIIFNVIRENLVEKVVDDSVKTFNEDVDNILKTQSAINNFIDKIFPD